MKTRPKYISLEGELYSVPGLNKALGNLKSFPSGKNIAIFFEVKEENRAPLDFEFEGTILRMVSYENKEQARNHLEFLSQQK